MEIKSLAGIGFGTLFQAFSRAFADYEVQVDAAGLQTMLTRRGFDPGLSFAAFDQNQIAAFTLNGIGSYNEVPTAYDTGTGTLSEYRGQGLATAIFEYSIPYLKQAGIQQYLLEVLQHNTKAISVYRNLGFETVREFNYSIQEASLLDLRGAVPGFPCTVETLDIAKFETRTDFQDFQPSWQNSADSIKRATQDFVGMGAFSGEKLVGYCIFEPASGDITQIAVDTQYRRKGVASMLLREIIGTNVKATVKVINTEIPCPSIDGFLRAKNINPTGRQFEMVKKL